VMEFFIPFIYVKLIEFCSYLQQPEKSPSKEQKKGRFVQKAKWLALLPLALRAIHIAAEPSGGWEQYFKGDERDSKNKRSRR
jgi:hypothetical protein